MMVLFAQSGPIPTMLQLYAWETPMAWATKWYTMQKCGNALQVSSQKRWSFAKKWLCNNPARRLRPPFTGNAAPPRMACACLSKKKSKSHYLHHLEIQDFVILRIAQSDIHVNSYFYPIFALPHEKIPAHSTDRFYPVRFLWTNG